MNAARGVTVALAAASMALAAGAQAAHGDIAGFGDGIVHVVGTTAHWLAAVAAGVWGMAFAWRRGWIVPLVFAAAVGAGAWAGAGGTASTMVATIVTASLIVLGALIASGRAMSISAAAAIVALFGAFHGYAEGAVAGKSGSVVQHAIGLAVATLALGAAGAGAGVMLRLSSRYGLRIAGLAIAAAGAWLALRG